MDENLINNWNRCVDIDDQVFFLGDFGLGDVNHLHSICSQLKGHKICIRGNHDRNASWMTRVGFSVVLESAFLKIGRHLVELIHIPTDSHQSIFNYMGMYMIKDQKRSYPTNLIFVLRYGITNQSQKK